MAIYDGLKMLKTILGMLCFAVVVQGEIMATVNYFQYSRDEKTSGSSNLETRLTSYDFNLQFIIGSRFLVGATQMTQTTSSDIRGHRESLAPNIGFLLGPVLIEGGPISKSVEKMNLDTSTEWRDGTGYYSAICVLDRISSWVLIGFQFTFLNIEYRKYFDGNIESSEQKKSVSVLNPSLRLSVLF